MTGFPHRLGGDGAAAPLTADLDGDGREEIILGTSDGEVHAFRADGSELPGWPVTTDPIELHDQAPGYASGAVPSPVHGSVVGGVAVGDLDRDSTYKGALDVVATDLQGKLYVWGPDGTRRDGFPVSTLPEYSFTHRSERDLGTPEGRVPDRVNRHDSDNRLGRALASGPALGNLDGSADGSLEIVAGAFDRHVYAWRRDGSPVPGWPVLLKDPDKVESVDPTTNEVDAEARLRRADRHQGSHAAVARRHRRRRLAGRRRRGQRGVSRATQRRLHQPDRQPVPRRRRAGCGQHARLRRVRGRRRARRLRPESGLEPGRLLAGLAGEDGAARDRASAGRRHR